MKSAATGRGCMFCRSFMLPYFPPPICCTKGGAYKCAIVLASPIALVGTKSIFICATTYSSLRIACRSLWAFSAKVAMSAVRKWQLYMLCKYCKSSIMVEKNLLAFVVYKKRNYMMLPQKKKITCTDEFFSMVCFFFLITAQVNAKTKITRVDGFFVHK